MPLYLLIFIGKSNFIDTRLLHENRCKVTKRIANGKISTYGSTL